METPFRWIRTYVRRQGLVALASLGLALSLQSSARAELRYDGLESSALAVAAYEASKARCVYSEKLGKALAEIDAFLDRNYGYAWNR